MRLRFAPSPTGDLHVGGARTALFNWLLARQGGGSFVLRIEDTDRERSRSEHVRAIVKGLMWLGLDWDEGPVFQAEGMERHRQMGLELLERGLAYRDFTPPAEFARAREKAVSQGAGTTSRLPRALAERVSREEGDRRAAVGEDFAVRFRIPGGSTTWNDLVRGRTDFKNGEIDDFVILRSDGTPTYNLAVVSDDRDMGITHVIRGDDHISNTPKQILLYRALGKPVPAFGHLPMILGSDGRRLSKRHGARSVASYAAEGFFPEAMVNFLALLGWSPGTDQEALSRKELITRFSLERVLKKSAVFDEAKLRWLNGRYMAQMGLKALARELRRTLAQDRAEPVPPGDGNPGVEASDASPLLTREAFQRMTAALVPRSRTLAEMAKLARPYVGPVRGYEEKVARRTWHRDPERAVEILSATREVLARVSWTGEALEGEMRGLAEELGVAAGKVFQPLRLALTGSGASPGIFDVLLILGRKRSVRRVEEAVSAIRMSAVAPGAP